MLVWFLNVMDKQGVICYLSFGIEFDQSYCVCFWKRKIMK